MAFELRDYQKEAVEAGLSVDNGILCLSTGAGKSLVARGLVESYEVNEKKLILQPNAEILKSNISKSHDAGLNATAFSASYGEKNLDGDAVYATVGSLFGKEKSEEFKKKKHGDYDKFGTLRSDSDKKRTDKGYEKKIISVPHSFMEAFKECRFIIDEAHSLNAESGRYRDLIKYLNPKSVIGLTATPYRSFQNSEGSVSRIQTRTRPRYFKDIVYTKSTSSLIKDGWLLAPEYVQVDTRQDMLVLNSSGSDYTQKSISAYGDDNDIESLIIDTIRQIEDSHNHILVFSPSVEMSVRIVDKLKNLGISADEISAKSKNRSASASMFISGKTKVMLNVGTLCLDSDTEILTSEGFVGMEDMSYDKKIAAWKECGGIEYTNPEHIVIREVMPNEKMVYSCGKSVKFRVTGNHRMVTLHKNSKGGHKVRVEAAEDLVGSRCNIPAFGDIEPEIMFVPQREYKSSMATQITATAYNYRKKGIEKKEARLIATSEAKRLRSMRYKNPHELTEDDCLFIGFWLGDGCLYKRRLSICQSMRYSDNVEWLDNLFERMNITHSRKIYRPTGNSIHESVRWTFARGTGGMGQSVEKGFFYLEPYLKKNGTEYLKGLNKTQLKNLLHGFWKADGNHHSKNDGGTSITGTQIELYELIQEIASCRGISVTIGPKREKFSECGKRYKDQYRMAWSNRSKWMLGKDGVKSEKPLENEKVWCVTSSTSYLICRRNGKVFVTGNTTGFDFPALDAIIDARPIRSVALHYQKIGRIVRMFEGKHGIVYDLAGNIRRLSDPLQYKLLRNHRDKHELYSQKGRMTSIPISDEPEWMMEMPHGKYKGCHIRMLPSNYIEWYLKNNNTGPNTPVLDMLYSENVMRNWDSY